MLDDFWLPGLVPYKYRDQVIQVVTDSAGVKWVLPVGKVLYARRWRRGRRQCSFIYLERLDLPRVKIRRFAKKAGYSALKALNGNRWVEPQLALRLQTAMAK
jgi:hypothetical protein